MSWQGQWGGEWDGWPGGSEPGGLAIIRVTAAGTLSSAGSQPSEGYVFFGGEQERRRDIFYHTSIVLRAGPARVAGTAKVEAPATPKPKKQAAIAVLPVSAAAALSAAAPESRIAASVSYEDHNDRMHRIIAALAA